MTVGVADVVEDDSSVFDMILSEALVGVSFLAVVEELLLSSFALLPPSVLLLPSSFALLPPSVLPLLSFSLQTASPTLLATLPSSD